jgi:dihydropteroate synthase
MNPPGWYPVGVGLLRALVDGRGEKASPRTLLMGVLNRTPDSFSDGGQFVDDARAVERALAMVEEGASIVDIGAESTRPGALAIPAAEQIARLGGTIRRLSDAKIAVSIDTSSVEVARFALDQGARIINSVELGPAEALGRLASQHDAWLVLMHSRGSMTSMPGFSSTPDDAYGDVVADVRSEWRRAAERALDAGLSRDKLLFDPGLGFHKNARHSLTLCARLDEFAREGFEIVAGPSRKSFVAMTTGASGAARTPPSERLGGTIAACLACARGGASFLRVHDVAAVAQALALQHALDAIEPAVEDPSRSLEMPSAAATPGASPLEAPRA